MATSINYKPSLEPDYTGPSWNNSNEYPALTSNEFVYDQQQLASLIERIEDLFGGVEFGTTAAGGTETSDVAAADPDIAKLQAITELEEQAWILLGNMRTYANCLACVDGSNTEANNELARLTALSGQLEALTKPLAIYLNVAPEEVLSRYFEHAHVKPHEFRIRYARETADTALSEAEESLLARLKANGPLAFGSQYNQLSSSVRCNYEETGEHEKSREHDDRGSTIKQIGLAEAAGLLRNADPVKRKNAWRAIQSGWRTHEVSVAAGLNAIAGWRLEVNKQRSRAAGRELHFLDLPLHDSRIKRETLEAMMTAVTDRREVGRRAVRAMARAFGKTQLDPCDLLAPAPRRQATESKHESRLTFEKGIALISDAFDAIDPSFRDFVDTMKKNRWIEGRQLPNKRPGAFCTEYPKSNSPRVFQTYMGSLEDVRTLAHELGHAYHAWVMKDLPRALTHYPMTIAETASIFAETAFSDALITKAKQDGNQQLAFEIAWQNTESAASHILNIPARFEFEYSFYEQRAKGFVSAARLSELTNAAWTKWYGDTLTENEKQFWMTKLHFSIPSVSFYNYPYTFGALFSLGIYALRKERGDSFWPAYNALLRDTGRMTAEDLALKHLQADLTKPDFWSKSLAIVDSQVSELEGFLR